MEEAILGSISDDELLRRLGALVSQSRRIEADVVSHIGEVDDRRLYSREAFPSMFAYCTGALHLSEAEAYLRITVARAARKHGVLLEMLHDGRLHLRGIAMLAPLLTEENRDSLLRRATHMSKREIEELVAELSPRPDVASSVRKLPQKNDQSASSEADWDPSAPGELCPGRVRKAALATQAVARDQPILMGDPRHGSLHGDGSAEFIRFARPAGDGAGSRPATEPLSPGRYKVQFTASAELRDKIERLTELMRSEIPDGDLALVIERAVSEKLERLEARRYGKTKAPRRTLVDSNTAPTSRAIPAAVRRAVHERDAGRCAYVDTKGRRCAERSRLEFHHRQPFGMGGEHRAENLSLLCRAHNAYLAELDYGRLAIVTHRQKALTRLATRPG